MQRKVQFTGRLGAFLTPSRLECNHVCTISGRSWNEPSVRSSSVRLSLASSGKQQLDTGRALMFGQSHSHRVWRMMSALIDARPEWADQDTFEADREKMLQHGLSTGMSIEELFKITDPDVILGLWTAAAAKEVGV